jgi:DNA polymerase III sliding clamp (beta) subunit (PCNA family)
MIKINFETKELIDIIKTIQSSFNKKEDSAFKNQLHFIIEKERAILMRTKGGYCANYILKTINTEFLNLQEPLSFSIKEENLKQFFTIIKNYKDFHIVFELTKKNNNFELLLAGNVFETAKMEGDLNVFTGLKRMESITKKDAICTIDIDTRQLILDACKIFIDHLKKQPKNNNKDFLFLKINKDILSIFCCNKTKCLASNFNEFIKEDLVAIFEYQLNKIVTENEMFLEINGKYLAELLTLIKEDNIKMQFFLDNNFANVLKITSENNFNNNYITFGDLQKYLEKAR